MKKNGILSSFGIWCIRLYQRGISPFIGGKCACRFNPTCSEYTKQAIEKYGLFYGTYLGIKRICRCRPGGGCGYDPVP
ncbi:MAG: membrane protein insertion efficiency factor YidD [Alphaproteobacteria bacterium]|nr:membrane protein insertion efficiency factor YidD [Alphaproteobacteria bacterium]